jgi:hypothetical protein
MAQSNTAYALMTLGQWSRNHGIYEVRDVLQAAARQAVEVGSSEELAAALEETAMAADVIACPAPVATPAASEQEAVQPAARKKPTKASAD